jgi:hypothetical protein
LIDLKVSSEADNKFVLKMNDDKGRSVDEDDDKADEESDDDRLRL